MGEQDVTSDLLYLASAPGILDILEEVDLVFEAVVVEVVVLQLAVQSHR